ncbi:MAG: right-handed parallel beta-helix repeat-containing protein, partial [archaeon]
TNDNDGCDSNCQFAIPPSPGPGQPIENIYYVDKDSIGGSCDDGNIGIESEPWCTVQHAMATLQAGDAVVVREGVYDNAPPSPACTISYTASPPALYPVNDGTETNPILIMGYPGEFPVFTFSDPADYGCRVIGSSSNSYIIIQGFYVDYSRLAVTNSDNIIVRGNIVNGRNLNFDQNAGGIFFQNVVYSLVQSNEVFGVVGSSTNEGCIQVFDRDPSDSSWIGTSSNVYENNYLHDCDDYGIYLKQSPYDDVIRRNWVENINNRGINVGGQLDSENIYIYENIVIGGSPGIVPYTSNGQTDSTFIYNNLVIGSANGIVAGATVYDTQLWNNIVMDSGSNALSYADDSPIFSYSDYNLFYNYNNFARHDSVVDSATLGDWQTNHNLDLNSIEAQPIFSDLEYHLDVISPGKVAGRYGEDLGAYPRGGISENDYTLIGAGDLKIPDEPGTCQITNAYWELRES